MHALNRFTFGPRPGDLEAVRAMGLEKWFNRQLHPETLDQSNLAARLAQFPAMQWSPQDLLFRLPSNAVIRQAADGKVPIPEGAALHAVYVNEIARYQVRQQQKEQQKQQASLSASAAMPGPSMNNQPMNGDAARMAPEPPQPVPAQPDSAQMLSLIHI